MNISITGASSPAGKEVAGEDLDFIDQILSESGSILVEELSDAASRFAQSFTSVWVHEEGFHCCHRADYRQQDERELKRECAF